MSATADTKNAKFTKNAKHSSLRSFADFATFASASAGILRCGSVLAETVLVMPLLLLLIFGILQFAQIWMARQMVVYAASCAARAMTVVHPVEQADAADKAAKLALSWLCLVETTGESGEKALPGVAIAGWGRIPGSGSVDRRVVVSVLSNSVTNVAFDGTDDKNPFVGATVSFRFPLLIPGMAINSILGNFANRRSQSLPRSADFYGNLARASANPIVDSIDGWPYVDLRETAVLPMPYSPANYPTNGYVRCRINGFR